MQEKNKKNITPNDTFGQRLRNLRIAKGLSQTRFATLIGYKRSGSISNIENDKTPPDTETLVKIAECLNADLHWLIYGKPSPGMAELANCVRPYAIAHLTEITLRLQRYERERRDLYARNSQGESLKGAIKELEALIQKEHFYYKKAWEDLDAALNLKTS